eukprot:TRINITY_DN1792_c1_g1_i1.p1 TRINITY_DN1792_c1_g1~~TRINITY_DN1792_c1_g1_i1.p1  ORF type:complete len:230 (-),score=47.52 TRINITY_DN1792_c1_g1_i1:67-756(-)
MSRKVAVILSGCGRQDGSDPSEVSPLVVALSRAELTPVFYAPYVTMSIGVNHVNGAEAETKRNVLVESARLVRDPVQKLECLNANDEDISALIIPGGNGVLYNLSNFATSYENPEVNEEVQRVILDFKSAGKPIGCSSFANVLVALVLPDTQITLGSDDEEECPNSAFLKSNLEERGTSIQPTSMGEVCVDSDNKVASAATYLYTAAKYFEIADTIYQLVDEVMALAED